MLPWPDATHGLKLSWITDPLACAQGVALRALVARMPSLSSVLGERLMNPRLTRATGGPMPVFALPSSVAVLKDLADRSRYADFWTALRSEGRLLADRSPEMMRWRLSDPDLTTRPILLAYNRGHAITGYALAMLGKGNSIEPPFLDIVDLVSVWDEPDAIPALVSALIDMAPSLGAAKVRLQTVSPRVLEQLGPLAQNARHEGGWGHCHVRFSQDAPDPALWSPTPFDGDYGICLRPVPTTAAHVSIRRERANRGAVSKA